MERIIIDFLYKLVYNNLYATSSQILANALKNRFIGFRSEIEFQEYCIKTGASTLEGGFILPLRDKKKTLDSPLYFTVDSKDPEQYKDLYKVLDKNLFSKLLYIKYDRSIAFNMWDKTSIEGFTEEFPVPNFEIFDFQNNSFISLSKNISTLIHFFTHKNDPFIQKESIDNITSAQIMNYLNNYTVDQLLNMYVSRLIFDGFIGLKYYKGIPSDIDLIRKVQNTFRFYEIKEKDLSKTHPIGFGIDKQRLEDIMQLSRIMNVSYKYIVRHVDNQTERNFVTWKYIDFKEFYEKTDKNIIKKGGTGMNTYGNNDNPTLLVEQTHFGTLD